MARSDWIVPPGRFIPIAESTGFIVPLGEWVLGEAFRQSVRWRATGAAVLVCPGGGFSILASIPKEGAVLSMDSMVLHKSGPRPDLAHRFMDFMLEGRNSSELTNLIGSGNPNRDAQQYIMPEVAQNPAISPGPEQLARLEMLNTGKPFESCLRGEIPFQGAVLRVGDGVGAAVVGGDDDLIELGEQATDVAEVREKLALALVFDKLVAAARELGGAPCGWQALETARTEHVNRTEEYLLGMPLLADYLEEGLDRLGYSVEDIEDDVL